MKIISFRNNPLGVLLLAILFLSLEIGISNGKMIFRKSEIDNSMSENKKKFEYDTCYKDKRYALVDVQKEPLLLIPNEQVANMRLSYKTCVDLPHAVLEVNVREGFRNRLKVYTTKLVKQSVALFIDDEFISALTISAPLEKGFAFGCLSYEKAASIIMNSGYTPNYEDTCVGGKTKIADLTTKYKFKEKFIGKRDYYPSVLNNSEFWYLQEEAPLHDRADGNVVARIPAKRIVEQYFNPQSYEFKSNGDWVKIIYHGELGWIKRSHAIPLFSLLDTNLFLQKFFIFNEYRYESSIEDKHMYSDYLLNRINTLRKLYFKEAHARFKDNNEFQKWYVDTFGKEFAAKYLVRGSGLALGHL